MATFSDQVQEPESEAVPSIPIHLGEVSIPLRRQQLMRMKLEPRREVAFAMLLNHCSNLTLGLVPLLVADQDSCHDEDRLLGSSKVRAGRASLIHLAEMHRRATPSTSISLRL